MSASEATRGVAWAIVSGVLQALALPPLGHTALAFVSAAPLLWASRGATPSRAFLLGTIQGTACVALASPWLPQTIASFARQPVAASLLLAAPFWLYHGARTGVAAAIFAGWVRLRGTPVIGWPIAVLATELLYPTIVPWYSAEQVAGAPALCQLAEVGGPLLVGACLAAANAGFASALVCLRANGARGWRPLAATIAGGAALLGYGHLRLLALDRSTRDAPAAQVAVVQPNLTRETQRDPATLARALALTADRSREAGALVVWPESVFDHLVEESERADWGAALARAMGPRPSERSPVLVGAYLAPASGPMRPSNALLLLDREGTIAGIYRKQKPLMFGEYVPFADVFPALDRWLPHAGRLTAGTSFEPLVVAGHRVAPLVCYEDLIPSFVREAVRRERPELLVDASNDAWFGHSSAWQHHVALATFRAIEHRLFFVRAGNDAGSVVVDPGGRIVASVAPYHAGSLSHEVRWLTIETPYARWGDAPLALACAALSLAQLARARRGSARTLGARATRITTPLVSPRYANPYAGTPVSRRVP